MTKDDLIDVDELRAFEAVAHKKSFSQAATALGVAQSTISLRISRLEKRTGRQLIRRTTRSVELTPDGASMLIYARSILAIAEDARRRLQEPPLDGLLKIGIEDEFATTNLPKILGFFRAQHPKFEMLFLTGRNEYINDALNAKDTDITLGKCHSGQQSGEVIWREELVWVGHPCVPLAPDDPVPLITYTGPSVTRDIVESALQAHHRSWISVAKGSNLLGLIAAAEAGMGVMAIGRNFITSGIKVVPTESGLPPLGSMDYVLQYRPGADKDPAVAAFLKVLRGFAAQFSNPPA